MVTCVMPWAANQSPNSSRSRVMVAKVLTSKSGWFLASWPVITAATTVFLCTSSPALWGSVFPWETSSVRRGLTWIPGCQESVLRACPKAATYEGASGIAGETVLQARGTGKNRPWCQPTRRLYPFSCFNVNGGHLDCSVNSGQKIFARSVLDRICRSMLYSNRKYLLVRHS
jgi:hypothetical protein